MSIFEKNGYTLEIERYSENNTSDFYNYVRSIELFDKDGEFVYGIVDVRYDNCVEQLLIPVICNYEVDLTKFK